MSYPGLFPADTIIVGTNTTQEQSSTTPQCFGITFDGTNVLDVYTTGTFAPTLSFALGTTGITYTQGYGSYLKIGKLVYFCINVLLSSKGSSTGVARVAVPFIPDTGVCNIAVAAENLTSITSGNTIVLQNNDPGSAELKFYQFSGSASSTLSDTNFGNTSYFACSGQFTATS